MDRETKTIATPKGRKVTIYTYITGRERRSLQDIFLKDVTVSGVETGANFSNFKASTINEANDFLLKALIVDIDGDKTNCYEKLLDMPADEYEFVRSEINKISEDWSAKKNS